MWKSTFELLLFGAGSLFKIQYSTDSKKQNINIAKGLLLLLLSVALSGLVSFPPPLLLPLLANELRPRPFDDFEGGPFLGNERRSIGNKCINSLIYRFIHFVY